MSRHSAGFDHDDPFHSEPEWRVQQRQADALERIADALEALAASEAKPSPDTGDIFSKVRAEGWAIVEARMARMESRCD